MIFVANAVFCQKSINIQHYTQLADPGIKPHSSEVSTDMDWVKSCFTKKPFSQLSAKADLITNVSWLIDPGFYTQHFGFFCQKELQFEKNTRIPLRFRLGSVQNCDWLEGKLNSRVSIQ